VEKQDKTISVFFNKEELVAAGMAIHHALKPIDAWSVGLQPGEVERLRQASRKIFDAVEHLDPGHEDPDLHQQPDPADLVELIDVLKDGELIRCELLTRTAVAQHKRLGHYPFELIAKAPDGKLILVLQHASGRLTYIRELS
jgi:hypothetical protein